MVMGEEQTRRLMELLGKLVARDAGTPQPDMETKLFSMPEFNGQEHNDAKTLYSLGWIRSLRFGGDVMNSWSGEGIYAFDLTEDGKAAIANWELGQVANADAASVGEEFVQRSRPLVMMVHGSKDGQVPPIIEEIRLWCFERGLDAFKAADLPNAGQFVNVKVSNTIDSADYYVVVLTADEELASGKFHARQNTMMEMGRVLDRNPSITTSVGMIRLLGDWGMLGQVRQGSGWGGI